MLNKIFNLLDKINIKKINIVKIIFYTIIVSLFDILGASAIFIFIKLLLSNKEENINILNSSYEHNSIILLISISLFFLYLLKFLISIYLNNSIHVFVQNILCQIRVKILNILFNSNSKDYSFSLQMNNINFVSEKIVHDVILVLFKSISDIFIIFILCMFLVYINSMVVIFTIFVTLIIIYCYDILIKKKLYYVGSLINICKKEMMIFSEYSLKSSNELHFLPNRIFFVKKFEKAAKLYSKYFANGQMFTSIPKYLIEFLAILFFLTIILIQISINNDRVEIFSEIAIFAVIVFRLLPLIYSLSQSAVYLRSSGDSFDLISDILDKKSSFKDDSYLNSFENIKNIESIKITNINYGYGKNLIFNDTNLNIQTNKFIGIQAPSGSGKSTLVDILCGNLTSDGFKYFINNKPLDFNKYRNNMLNNISYIPQNPIIFEGNLLSNITLKDDNFLLTEFHFEILKSTGILKILELSKKDLYNFEVEHLGVNLSGGQKQRIALARALFNNKNILIFDEPTSSLDISSSISIYKLFNEITKLNGKTIICVSHDDNLLNYCDTFITISNLKINDFTKTKT